MKCPRCNGNGSVPYHIADDLFDETNCPLCGGSGEVMTNEEWIHTLNTERLAGFLCEVWCGIDEVINIMSEDGEINKKDAVVKWLKQQHRG